MSPSLPKQGPPGSRDHPAYGARAPFTACDLKTEQTTRIQLLRRHRRYLHGWGVVCGLRVAAAPDLEHPWNLFICPGYALSPCGDEIYVPQAVPFDLASSLWVLPSLVLPRVFVTLAYAERERGAAVKPSSRCGCEEPVYVSRRIVDGVELAVTEALPQFAEPHGNVCAGDAPCPSCPPSCEIVLAAVQLPKSRKTLIVNADIDNWTFRKQA